MSNLKINKVIVNSDEVLDYSRECNLLYLNNYRKFLYEEHKTHTFTPVNMDIALIEYADNGETIELFVGNDSNGELIAFELEDEWLLYMEENFGKLM